MTYFLYQGSNLKNVEEILLKKVSIRERKSEDFCDIRILGLLYEKKRFSDESQYIIKIQYLLVCSSNCIFVSCIRYLVRWIFSHFCLLASFCNNLQFYNNFKLVSFCFQCQFYYFVELSESSD